MFIHPSCTHLVQIPNGVLYYYKTALKLNTQFRTCTLIFFIFIFMKKGWIIINTRTESMNTRSNKADLVTLEWDGMKRNTISTVQPCDCVCLCEWTEWTV